MTQNKQDEEILEDEEAPPVEVLKSHIPVAKVSRFGPQSASKFGKWAMSANPPMKQRPGRAAGRGR